MFITQPLYRKLGTQVWFAGHCEVVEELVKALENNIDNFKELKPVCREVRTNFAVNIVSD